MESELKQSATPTPTPAQQNTPSKLTDVEIVDENIALNVIIQFLVLAQKRGCFAFDESAKIFECIKKFQR
jgi:hypothetical protein